MTTKIFDESAASAEVTLDIGSTEVFDHAQRVRHLIAACEQRINFLKAASKPQTGSINQVRTIDHEVNNQEAEDLILLRDQLRDLLA